MQVNSFIGKFGSLINGIIDRQFMPLPFANFGDILIFLLIRTCLGIIEECFKLNLIACKTFLNLPEIMSGIKQSAKLNPTKVQLSLIKLLKGDIFKEELEPEKRYLNRFLFLA